MSTTDLAQQISALHSTTQELTQEVVGQKARLIAAADLAASKASESQNHASAASLQATNAASSASSALASKNAAATSKTNSATSEANALASKQAAAISETNAATSEANALASANAAEASLSSLTSSQVIMSTNMIKTQDTIATLHPLY